MSAQSEILGNAAAPHTFVHKDKTYTLRLIDDKLNVEWERKQLARAREFEAGNRPLLSDVEFGKRLDALSEKYHAGHYSLFRWLFGHKDSLEKSKDGGAIEMNKEMAAGMLMLTALVFNCEQAEMQSLLAERGAEVASLLGVVVRESLPVPEKNQAADGEQSPNS